MNPKDFEGCTGPDNSWMKFLTDEEHESLDHADAELFRAQMLRNSLVEQLRAICEPRQEEARLKSEWERLDALAKEKGWV